MSDALRKLANAFYTAYPRLYRIRFLITAHQHSNVRISSAMLLSSSQPAGPDGDIWQARYSLPEHSVGVNTESLWRIAGVRRRGWRGSFPQPCVTGAGLRLLARRFCARTRGGVYRPAGALMCWTVALQAAAGSLVTPNPY